MRDLLSSAAPAAMTPWDYVRLRRLAAGLTIEQAARRHWHRPEHRADVEANTRAIEQPGYVMKPWLAATIDRSFPFSAEVYRALAEEPASRHPKLCRTCGWDRWTAAYDLAGDDVAFLRDGEGAELDSCTRCHQLEERRTATHRRAA